MTRDNNRRRVIVKGFQARFVVVQMLWAVGALVAFAAALLGPLIYSLLTAGPSVATAVADQFLLLHSTLWPVLAGLIAMLAAVFVRMSHRIAGPLHRFRLAFDDVAEGRLDVAVKTRPNDYLKQEEDALNGMIGSLRERVRDGQVAIDELEQLIAERRADPRPPTHADIDTLQARVRHVKSVLARFVAGSQGFSSLEILMVLTVVVVLTSLAAPTYLSALDAARVARATGDIHSIELEVTTHSIRVGCFPGSLAEIGRDQMTDPWGRRYAYGVISKRPGSVSGANGSPPAGCNVCQGVCLTDAGVRKNQESVPLNGDFDVYSLGKDGLSQAPLTALVSLDDVVRANNGAFVGLARTY